MPTVTRSETARSSDACSIGIGVVMVAKNAIAAALVSATVAIVLCADPVRSVELASASAGADVCPPILGGVHSGQEAIDELGSNLPVAAANAGMAASDYSAVLLTDATFNVDSCGMTLVHEEAMAGADSHGSQESRLAGTADRPTALSVPADVFNLSSRPGSQRTIYLDFDGASLAGAAIREYLVDEPTDAAPYDVDSDPTTFSEAERSNVYETWLRVSEDFAPLDVNVTTLAPAPSALAREDLADEQFGVPVVITDALIDGGSPGLAFIGVFDTTAEAYKHAIVSAPNALDETKLIAESASHELGHTLGLSHAGTQGSVFYSGHNAWAPIMGASFSRPISQFSKGEYQGSNNPDDNFATMATNGAVPVTDDVSDEFDLASPLMPGAAASGQISTESDVDAFSFFAAGPTTLDVSVAAVGANLDARLRVYNSDRALIATANPDSAKASASLASGLDASYEFEATPGTYFAKVDGSGLGDPLTTGYSNYGSRGAFSVLLDSSTELTAQPSELPAATAGVAYELSLSVSGGGAPYVWTLDSGALPDGLTLSSDGVISGTPTTSGSSTAVLRVGDGTGQTLTTDRLSLVVNPQSARQAPLRITPPGIVKAKTNRKTSITLVATGGTAPYRWAVIGKRPQGVSLTRSGRLSVKVGRSATLRFVVRATDSAARVAKRTVVVRVR